MGGDRVAVAGHNRLDGKAGAGSVARSAARATGLSPPIRFDAMARALAMSRAKELGTWPVSRRSTFDSPCRHQPFIEQGLTAPEEEQALGASGFGREWLLIWRLGRQ